MSPRFVKLGDLIDVLSGFAFKSEYFNDSDGLPVIRIRDVVRGYSDTYYSGSYTEPFIVVNDDILIGMDGNFNAARWRGGRALLNQRVCKVTAKQALLDEEYLYHYLPIVLKKIEDATPFVTVKHLSAGDLRDEFIPLPSLPEQRRIAAILDKADALRAERREALAQLDSLTQSIFIEMFGDAAVNPRKWSSMTVGETAVKFSDGPFGSNLKSSHYAADGVRVIRLQNIGICEFVDRDRVYISEEHFNDLRKHECLPGDLLIGTLGDPNLRACIQPITLSRALNKADCVQLRPNPMIANSEYLCALLNQPAVEAMAQELMLGQTRVRISMGRLRGLQIPVPPLDFQRVFASRIRAVESVRALNTAALAESNALFASLQHRAFSGEL